MLLCQAEGLHRALLAVLQLHMCFDYQPTIGVRSLSDFFQSDMMCLRTQQKSLFVLRNSYMDLRATGLSWDHALLQPFVVLTNISGTEQIHPHRKGAGLGFLLLLENADSIPTESVLLSPCEQADLGTACSAAANWEQDWCRLESALGPLSKSYPGA